MAATTDLGLDPFLEELEYQAPDAAASYRQAIIDLAAERLSYRGPANELRQALWEVLQVLGPDDEVTKEPGFKLEPRTTGPTHRQRAAFIMRKRRGKDLPETTATAIDAVAALARATYTRSNSSTHGSRGREEAEQVGRYVEAVLRDLLT
jgi:hypothetical protein